MSDVTQILTACQSGDTSVRTQAEKTLQQARTSNLPQFYVAMSGELCNDSKPKNTRQLAGVILKNCLDANNDQLAEQRAKEWLALPAPIRNQVKHSVIKGLGSSVQEARDTCAQVVAKIARIECPKKMWPQLIPGLQQQIMKSNNASLMQSSTHAIGMCCEEVDPSAFTQDDLNKILTAIVFAMTRKDSETAVRGCKALFLALEFIENNMKNKKERDVIMTNICNATNNADARVRKMAFECMWRVAEIYYEFLGSYMQALFKITLRCVSQDQPLVALQAFEFWLTICEVEAGIVEDAAEGKGNLNKSANYARGALKHLLPLIFTTLVKQDEDQDEDTWNIAKAGGVGLKLLTYAVGPECCQPVLHFITQKIRSQNWRDREAAYLAFGSVLIDKTKAAMEKATSQILPHMVNTIEKDPHELVKDTACWALGVIMQRYGGMLPKPARDACVRVLIGALTLKPSIANNAAYGIHNLGTEAEKLDDDKNFMGPYFEPCVKALLRSGDREDADECNLRMSSYEAINVLIGATTPECTNLVKQLVPLFCNKLAKCIEQVKAGQKIADQLLGLLIGAIQTCINKLDADILQFANGIMHVLLPVFEVRNSTTQEEAFMAIGALANAIEARFLTYMNAFAPHLIRALTNHQESQVFIVATGALGDVCRALEGGSLPTAFCDNIVTLLLRNLENEIDRNCKAPILSVFGDIALSVEDRFQKYIKLVMQVLHSASQTTIPDQDDEESVDFLATLRSNVLDAYAGIVQGMSQQPRILQQYFPAIVKYLQFLINLPDRDEHRTKSIAGVLVDVTHCVGPSQMHGVLRDRSTDMLLRDLAKIQDETARDIAQMLREARS